MHVTTLPAPRGRRPLVERSTPSPRGVLTPQELKRIVAELIG